MTRDVVVPILVAIIGLFAGGGLVPLVQAYRGRGRARADLVTGIGDLARRLAEDAEEDLREAREQRRIERAETAAEMRALRDEVRQVRAEAHALAAELHRVRAAILAPTATVDGLRALVQRGADPANGQV